jgi:hypothetical protein
MIFIGECPHVVAATGNGGWIFPSLGTGNIFENQ